MGYTSTELLMNTIVQNKGFLPFIPLLAITLITSYTFKQKFYQNRVAISISLKFENDFFHDPSIVKRTPRFQMLEIELATG